MRPLTTFSSLLFVTLVALPDSSRALELPETAIAYEIEVSLEPGSRRLGGRETIRWTNPSRTAVVERVPLHLYLNAFAHEETTWMRRTLPSVSVEEILHLYDDPWGWSEPRSIRQDGAELEWGPIAPDDANPLDRTLIEVRLAEPVAPGDTLVLEIELDARLPVTFARTGGYGDFFFAGQWYPKVAAFETARAGGAVADGFDAHQFHGLTEFYADFADYDVRIGVPAGWTLAATGRGEREPSGDGPLDWYRFRQRAVHDFAFAAGASLVDRVSSHDPAGPGGPVEIHMVVPAGAEGLVPGWLASVEGALDVLGARVGPYPYDTLTAVFPPYRALQASGMEYPTLITGVTGEPFWDGALVSGFRLPAYTITHEVAHQYFQGIVASNELEEAHLDEGLAEYWGVQAMIGTWGAGAAGTLLGRPVGLPENEWAFLPPAELQLAPMRTRPSFLQPPERAGVFYSWPKATLTTAAALHGQDAVDRLSAAYFQRWAFRHPRLEDLLDVAREVSGDALADLLLEAYSRTRSPDYRIEAFDTQPWSPPRGRLVLDGAGLEPDGAHALVRPASDGALRIRVLDPGYGGRHEGHLETRTVVPERGEPEPGWAPEDDALHVSTVRLAGPAWESLPVEVVLRFADGAVFRETWDGRAPAREYRVVGSAPLCEARVDPEGRIALDPDRVNNGLRREPDRTLAGDWSAWLAALFQLLAEGLAQWL